jgi:hypothetical protein
MLILEKKKEHSLAKDKGIQCKPHFMRKSVEVMSEYDCFPDITVLFDILGDNPNNFFYHDIIRHTLRRILPKTVCNPALDDPDLLDDQRQEFFSTLPIIHVTPCKKTPSNMSFFVLSKYRVNAFQFFFDMISHWLIPGKRLNVVLFYAVDFRIPAFGQDIYTLCEVMVNVSNEAELEALQSNWPIIDSEIRLGMQSNYYARRILEIKGLSADAKTAMIQEYIAHLMTRLPKDFDYDVLTEMQHVLVICRDEFKEVRGFRHLSRIISVHYLFRKSLREAVKKLPGKRHLSLKLQKAVLHLQEGDKPVLGVLVGINFLGDKEVFEERHLLSAIQNYIPSAKGVENSFFANRRGNEHVCTLYLEIEKCGSEEFSPEEIRLLRRELPTDLKDRIEHLMHPIFMPRNEEEVMRNILSLSNQIKYLHDLPQVIISFDEQTHSHLFFTVILVAVMKPGCQSVQDKFKTADTLLEYIHDRSKTVGFLRKKYAKEATVFGVKLFKHQFLRRDHSIDLNKARQTVVNELTNVVGEVRDFNGGMISKQHELLCTLREMLNSVKYNELLLENFFYSLTPDVMRTVLEPHVLKNLFLLLLESIEQGFFSEENYSLKIQKKSQHVLVMIKAEDKAIKEIIARAINKFDWPSSKMATSFVLVYDIAYLGYLFICDEPEKQKHFCQTLQASILNWDQKKRAQAYGSLIPAEDV